MSATEEFCIVWGTVAESFAVLCKMNLEEECTFTKALSLKIRSLLARIYGITTYYRFFSSVF